MVIIACLFNEIFKNIVVPHVILLLM